MFNMNWPGFKQQFFVYLNELYNFNFSVFNPVFWILFLILALILLKKWKAGKAFSFSLIVAVILLAATKIEAKVSFFFQKSGESFDGVLVRLGALMIICVVALYYFFMKSEY